MNFYFSRALRYKNKQEGRLISAIKNDTDNTRIGRPEITRNQKWEETNVLSV